MSLSPAFLDELRARTSLSTLIGKTVKVQKAGKEYKACCPFHNEKTPSFTINDDKGFYHCFGCGAHGDAIRWMTDQRGLPFMDAVKELAQAAGLDLPAPDPRAAKKAEQARGLHDVTEAAQCWFVAQLDGIEGAEARAYLDKRGLSDATRRAFGLGFAPDSRTALRTALREFGDPMLVESGMVIAPEADGGRKREPYDRFRGRLMIPIRDARGRVIAFGGRILGQGEPKYLNSPDTPLFDKGRTLYNLDKALPAARKAGRIIVVEGYMDVIALAQAGIEECVAPLGTALTEHQIERLWKIADVPLLCFDGDGAGQKAADRAALRALPILKPGMSLSFVTLPAGMDPDDVVRGKGKPAFEPHLERAQPLVERIWNLEHKAGPLDTPEARAGLKQRISELLATIAHENVRREYQRNLNDKFWNEFGWKKRDVDYARRYISESRHEVKDTSINISTRIDIMMKRAVLLGISRHTSILYHKREDIFRLNMPTPNLTGWRDLLIQTSFYHESLEESLIDAILADTLVPVPEVRNLKHDLGFSFFRRDQDNENAIGDLENVIDVLLFEQEYPPKLEQLSARLYARGADAEIDEDDWQAHLALLAHKRRNDEWLSDLKANIEEQLLAA